MVIELIVNRGWGLWLDGQKPKPGWDAPDEDGRWGDEFTRSPRFGNIGLARLRFLRLNGDVIGLHDDWIEDEEGPSRPAYIEVLTESGDFRVLTITHIVYGSDRTGPLLVTTGDGEQHDIDEVTTYIRAELKETA